MNTINRLFVFFIIICISHACSPSEDYEVSVAREDIDLFVSGKIKEAGQSEFTDFKIDFSNNTEELGRTFWHGNVSDGELGSTFIFGNYSAGLNPSKPLFGLQFWSDDLPGDRNWSSDELENFFAPGNSFSFGQGPGHIDLLLKLPIGGPYDVEASRSSYLVDPQGSLSILSIEDYDYPTANPLVDRSYGKLVRCTFSGQIGRYDFEADRADGSSGFITDEIVELEDGELFFYVEYEQI